jgi:hypothetical protein
MTTYHDCIYTTYSPTTYPLEYTTTEYTYPSAQFQFQFMSPLSTNPFAIYGICRYCENESTDNLMILDTFVCIRCFKKALDTILLTSLNKRVIEQIEMIKEKNGEDNKGVV